MPPAARSFAAPSDDEPTTEDLLTTLIAGGSQTYDLLAELVETQRATLQAQQNIHDELRAMRSGNQRGVAGGSSYATGGAVWTEICRIEGHDTKPITVQTAASPPTAPAGVTIPSTARVVVRVTVGNGNRFGGGSMTEQLTLAGNPLRVTGSHIYVSALVSPNENADFAANAPLDARITSRVVASATEGSGGSDAQPTQWIVPFEPLQSSQQVTTGPSRIKQLQGFNHSSSVVYIMFFDNVDGGANVPNGSAPLFTIPVGGLPTSPGGDVTFSDDFITSTRVFHFGIYWVASSTADFLTATGGEPVRMDIELFAQANQVGTAGSSSNSG